MIDYYDFKKYMTKIEEFNILCNKLYDIGFGSEPLWEYIATIIDLLEIIVNLCIIIKILILRKIMF